MYQFLLRMKDPCGGFHMQEDGELDVRSTYCALSIASLLNLITPELIENTAEYIVSCQTYEGGMGGCPGNEAHGGYTFCAFAGLCILGKSQLIDIDRLIYWAVSHQMLSEGGFCGRTNKLVDSCYSFWQGALFPLLDEELLKIKSHKPSTFLLEQNLNENQNENQNRNIDNGIWLFDQIGLQNYILFCCQDINGGLKDKPGKNCDFYHTCYSLCGLSIAQNNLPITEEVTKTNEHDPIKLKNINSRYGVASDKIELILNYFKQQPIIIS
eukprot:TRINITY_DN5131_c0_g4_i1.p1 TRINITY_DN5131_c0_g4~~TRINITY_DN5131_c0_g4_i1.p1  ORF type:complete len:269 (-),score=117.27 TRINITY_DN5131_c0_g4_i1:191-997(-)